MFYFLVTCGAVLAGLVIAWMIRSSLGVAHLLKSAWEVLGSQTVSQPRLGQTVRGTYKGRDVSIGAVYSGIKGEFLPLPDIRMRLKEVIEYNINRLPHYAKIDRNDLVYLPKLNLPWGVFDRAFPTVFSKNYLVMALERMLATAEDLERGRTIKELLR
ncbi:MAG: hypothetical protein WC732_01785 [Candidatus Omnitrophota bacterium]